MSPDPRLLEKLRKLFSYQEDSEKRNSIHEAANAAQRIQDLLIKHNLSMADINGKLNQPNSSDIIREMINGKDIGYNKRYGKWIEQLIYTVCEYNLCKLIVHSTYNEPNFAIIGKPDNVEIVIFLVNQLMIKALLSEKEEWKHYRGNEAHGMWRRGYLMGFALGIKSKLKAQLESFITENNSVTSLVRVHKEAIDNFINESYSNLGKSRTGGNSSEGSYTGFRNGKNTDIHKGLNSNTLNQRLIS